MLRLRADYCIVSEQLLISMLHALLSLRTFSSVSRLFVPINHRILSMTEARRTCLYDAHLPLFNSQFLLPKNSQFPFSTRSLRESQAAVTRPSCQR